MFSNVFSTIWSNPENRILEKQIHGETVVLVENEGRLCAAKRIGHEFVPLILSGMVCSVKTALEREQTYLHLKGAKLQLVGKQSLIIMSEHSWRHQGSLPDALNEILTNSKALKRWFQDNPHLTALGRHSEYENEELVALAAALPYSQVSTFHIDCRKIKYEGIKALADALPQSQISTLELRIDRVDSRVVPAIASVLPYTSISKLIITLCHICDDGAKALAAVLPFSSVLHLSLNENGYDNPCEITDKGLSALAEALPLSPIRTLHLRDVYVSPESAKALATAFSLSQVSDFELSHPHGYGRDRSLSAEAAKTLATALPNTRIARFYLSTPINDGADAIVEALPHSPIIYLQMDAVSKSGWDALKKALPLSQVSYCKVPPKHGEESVDPYLMTNRARDKEFFEVCRSGTPEEAEQLLKEYADVRNAYHKLAPALCIAVERNHRNMVLLLLKHGAGPSYQDGAGYWRHALDIARQLGYHDLVELLQNNGSSLTSPPEVEVPKTYYCPKTQQIFYDPVIAANGKTYEREAIEEHFKTHNTIPDDDRVVVQSKILIPNAFCKGLITELIQKYPHLEQQTYIPNASRNACLAALRAQDVSSLKDLLVKDSRLLSVGFPDGRLIELACRASPELLKVVIEAYPTRPYFNHLLCIKAAEGLGAEGVRLIFSMLPKQEPVSLRLAILKAAELTSGAYTRALLELGANPNAIDSEGRSLLHLAVGAGSKDVIRVLMEYEADLKAVDRQGHTPLQIAEQIQHFELIRYIKQKKIEVKFRPFLAPLQEQINAQGRVIQQLRGALVETQTSLGNIVPLLGANPSLSSVADELVALRKRIDQHFS